LYDLSVETSVLSAGILPTVYFNYNQCYINVFRMNGWINGLTVYNVHVMFEISAKFQQSCMICQLKLVFYLLEFYPLLIRITVHFFLFCAIPFETDLFTLKKSTIWYVEVIDVN
jgi:hypothetical protein